MSYNDFNRKHRRLAILRHLEACTDYTSNASILTDVLDHVGVTSTRSQVITELQWLKENGFITTQENGDFVVATATLSGAEIATGRSTHPEVQRPSPKA
ncbi:MULTISPECIES: hypothetical protein [Leisingera]|uniref:ArsR family transcriptional regulator n=1 Tax=Leisingera methylohalidivorans DSM 14336 TaxID=999552 RepID=V9VQZ7_9RHOB|nr:MULTISPECIES: hypothetical protein [Leisingera]AHD01181.1 hypothetical protein METH_11275 [Leisingera methylohalidivorans DSM 14336]UWQ76816.1 hypothetical protein K3724_10460 [Leisingera sp. M658]